MPVRPERRHPYGGRAGDFPWPDSLVEVEAAAVGDLEIDLVLYQSDAHGESIASSCSPRSTGSCRPSTSSTTRHGESAFQTVHRVREPGVLVVHVTHFNRLMWDGGDGSDDPRRARRRRLEKGLVS